MKNMLLCLATCLTFNPSAKAQKNPDLGPQKAILSPATTDGWHEVKLERPSCDSPNYVTLPVSPCEKLRFAYPLGSTAYIKRIGDELIVYIKDKRLPSDTLSMVPVPDSASKHCANCSMAFASNTSKSGGTATRTNIPNLYMYFYPEGQYGLTVETLVR